MKLSENFYLSEFEHSDYALRNDIDNTAPPAVVANLQRLCIDILQPLRGRIERPIRITSGYRCRQLNGSIGGSPRSAHIAGLAADIQVPCMTPLEVAEALAEIRCDKIIQEFDGWVHVQVAPTGAEPRLALYTACRAHGRTHYVPGLMPADEAAARV